MNTKDWKPEFRERYLKHADELRWLYCELYHNDLQAFDYFTEMMYQAYLARPERLKLMALMGMGIKQGDTVTVSVDGADEDAAAAAIEAFFKENL